MSTPAKSRVAKNETISPPVLRNKKQKVNPADHNDTEGWEQFTQSLPTGKGDYSVKYYMTESPGGPPLVQANRDYIGKALVYFSNLSKRDRCPSPSAAITAILPIAIQGPTMNMDANTALPEVFKTAKHIHSMCKYLWETRANENNIVLYISVDGSGFYPIQ